MGVIVRSIQRELLVEDVVDLWNNNKCNYSHSSTNSSNVVTIKYADNVQARNQQKCIYNKNNRKVVIHFNVE